MSKQGTTIPASKTKKLSSASDFKSKVFVDLLLPSGNVCRAKKPGLQAYVAKGKIPNSLSAIVSAAMRGIDPTEGELNALKDLTPEQLADAARFTDQVVCDVVAEPKVHMAPDDEADRDEELLYSDEVDETDKNFIVNWAFGGTSDVAVFLQEQEKLVGDLQAGRSVEEAAK